MAFVCNYIDWSFGEELQKDKAIDYSNFILTMELINLFLLNY